MCRQDEKTIGVGYDAASNNYYSGNIVIPETVSYNGEDYTVTSIGSSAFDKCRDLRSISMPNTITSIGDNAFGYCSNITKVVCKSTTPPTIESQTFYNISTSATLYVPIGSKATYSGAEYWKEFTYIEEEALQETTITIMDASNQGSVSIKSYISTDFEFTVTPATGYIVNTVLVNGEEISESETGTYTIELVSGAITISVSYELDPATGVNSLNTSNVKVYGYNNTLTVTGTESGETISVYDLNGTMVHTQSSVGSTNNIALNSNGIYIVKVNNKSFKVIL